MKFSFFNHHRKRLLFDLNVTVLKKSKHNNIFNYLKIQLHKKEHQFY